MTSEILVFSCLFSKLILVRPSSLWPESFEENSFEPCEVASQPRVNLNAFDLVGQDLAHVRDQLCTKVKKVRK